MRLQRIAIIVLFLSTVNTAMAQFVNGVGVFGKVGLSAQNWEYTGTSSIANIPKENLAVFGAGFYLEMLKSKHFKLRPQLTYLQRGYYMKFNKTDQFGNFIEEIISQPKMHYVALDILAKVTLALKKINPYLIAGIRLDFNVAQTTDSYTSATFDSFDVVEAGFVGAFGIEMWRVIFLEFEFNPTIGNSFESIDLNVSNTLWTFNVGLRLAKKDAKNK